MPEHDNYSQFEKRKQDHLHLALDISNQASEMSVLDQVTLRHEALPNLDFHELSIATSRFGHVVSTPFFVSSMTAGHRDAQQINRHLIAACAETGWAMGVGSQRRELTDPDAAFEWQPLTRDFPAVQLFGNLGIAQLIKSSIADLQRLNASLESRALIIHCNPLQEVLQPEGTPQFKTCWQALEQLVRALEIPVVVKETGCGFSTVTLKRLQEIGVAAVDVSGLGGTHWGRIEGQRNATESTRHRAAQTFKNWGIDTVQSVKNAVNLNPCYEIWGSGGVRHGLDAARLLALGVSMVGFAKPMLSAALMDSRAVVELMRTIEYELKVALFCTGSASLADLKGKVC